MKAWRSTVVLGFSFAFGIVVLSLAPLAAGEPTLRLPRPLWKPGFSWTYLRTPEKTPDQKRTVEYKVRRAGQKLVESSA